MKKKTIKNSFSLHYKQKTMLILETSLKILNQGFLNNFLKHPLNRNLKNNFPPFR